MLRIDPELYDALERWASDEFRSMNGQIEYLLSQALKKAGRLPKKKESSGNQKDRKDGDADVVK